MDKSYTHTKESAESIFLLYKIVSCKCDSPILEVRKQSHRNYGCTWYIVLLTAYTVSKLS